MSQRSKKNAPLFSQSKVETTDRVARAAGTTRGIARSLAADIQVSRLGRTFAWTERDYRVLVKVLADEGDGEQGERDDGEE